jgi:HK97 family phage major capsid protein
MAIGQNGTVGGNNIQYDPSSYPAVIGYDKIGIFAGMFNNASVYEPRFSLRGSGGNYLRWNGSTLDINGDIFANSGTFNGTINASAGNFVGNMTVAGNLTGDAVRTYQPGVAMVPNRLLNFRNLIPAVSSSTGIYTLYRETGVEGSISVQATPGDAKTQIDYDLTAVTYTARYIAGYARIDKSMLQDLPFLQSALPQMLLRDFYKAEDAKFYADLSGAATGSTTTTATVDVEQIIDYITNLEGADFAVNGIVVNPKQWGRLLLTKPSDYSIPGGVTITSDGNIAIAGIPVFKSSFIADDKVLLGDWNMAKRVVVDDLKVEFFEQDSDNIQKNLVTVRIEAREVLAIDRLDAFVFADLGNVA